jgi:hypothetical protein
MVDEFSKTHIDQENQMLSPNIGSLPLNWGILD